MTKTQNTRRRPSVALVLAFVALFTALSNGAYAVATAQKNSVVSKSIKNGQVKAADLAPNGVTSAKIGNAAVGTEKLKPAAVGTDQLQTDAVTSAEVADGTIQGADLGEGSVGAYSLANIATTTADSPATVDTDGINNGGLYGTAEVTATCPVGVAIGGGAAFVEASTPGNETKNVYVQGSRLGANGWTARGIVDFGAQGSVKLRAYVYCLMPTPAGL